MADALPYLLFYFIRKVKNERQKKVHLDVN